MGPSSTLAFPAGDRRWRASAVCVLALAVALAQLVASWAWASGAHVTVEQLALHEEAVAHGHADHHGGHAHGHHHAGHHVSAEVLGPAFVPAPDPAGPYQDVLNGALAGRPDLLSRTAGRRVDPPDGPSPTQNFPPVPHRPPIIA